MTNILERLDRLSDVIGGSVLGGPMLIADAKKEIVELRAAVVSEREACAKIADDRAAVCLDAAENYHQDAPAKATERCAHHEATHIARLIRARVNTSK